MSSKEGPVVEVQVFVVAEDAASAPLQQPVLQYTRSGRLVKKPERWEPKETPTDDYTDDEEGEGTDTEPDASETGSEDEESEDESHDSELDDFLDDDLSEDEDEEEEERRSGAQKTLTRMMQWRTRTQRHQMKRWKLESYIQVNVTCKLL